MERDKLLQYVAPCSLMCYTCPALKNGGISKCASKLCKYFEGYYDFNDANMPEEYRGWLQEFQSFYDRLVRYTNRPCLGCRSDVKCGCVEDCVVPNCIKEKGIDFCAECLEFPCEKAKKFFEGINNVIGKDWVTGSRRIAEIGIEQYFEEKKNESHYKSYKKINKEQKMEELKTIMEKFATCGWELICVPSQQWLEGKVDNNELIPIIQEADRQCGSCGCEFDPLYKRALELL